MTENEEEESELTELSSMPKVQRVERKALTMKQHVLKNAAMVISSKRRLRPCDWCETQN